MKEFDFPYNLPIWRDKFQLDSPDGKWTAKIFRVTEVSMGNPTTGTLELSNGYKLDRCNLHLTAFACFYKNVLQWDERKFKLPPRPRIKKLPNILSVEEIKRLFEATANLKHRVSLKTVYSAGLRISEVVRLKPWHIESDPSRIMIRIEQGKGKKDRYTILSNCINTNDLSFLNRC